ncbi:hypothetical protein [uncultured Chitinophaga sp.]|uniref:LA_2272 family surface repeat-containing protein n=1 Tax=uncultured Chitinophaga sp. TaxID=339340 RepID=UPI0025DCC1AE|nr:hypothetical protein [uncultured Chitinophaga sp.]
MSSFANTGFRLYRNVVYKFQTSDGKPAVLRLADVTPDSLRFIPLAVYEQRTPDTVTLHPRQLSFLYVEGAGGFFTKTLNLQLYQFIFEKDTSGNYIPGLPKTTFVHGRETHYELLPSFTRTGIKKNIEPDSISRYQYVKTPNPVNIDSTYRVRKVFGFTPTKVEEINGLSFGFSTKNDKNRRYHVRDTLITRGINIELNPIAIIGPIALVYSPRRFSETSYAYYRDTLAATWEAKNKGLNISLANVHDRIIEGVNLTATFTVVNELHGLHISALTNSAYVIEGVAVSLLNDCVKSRGFQLGLVNRSRNHRGLQIGLWNVNGKRKLPLINWQLKG